MSVRVERTKKESREVRGVGESISREELERIIETVNEIMKHIWIVVEDEDIDIIAKDNLDEETRERLMYEIDEIADELMEKENEIVKRILKAILGEKLIDAVRENYEKLGFRDWLLDRCDHYGFVRVDGDYAIIYRCPGDWKIRYSTHRYIYSYPEL
jgi:hypothetical protein